jgi:hypothetical protein
MRRRAELLHLRKGPLPELQLTAEIALFSRDFELCLEGKAYDHAVAPDELE